MLRTNSTWTGLALTRDFRTWLRPGRITDPRDDNRDVILFPEKIAGKFVMLHLAPLQDEFTQFVKKSH